MAKLIDTSTILGGVNNNTKPNTNKNNVVSSILNTINNATNYTQTGNVPTSSQMMSNASGLSNAANLATNALNNAANYTQTGNVPTASQIMNTPTLGAQNQATSSVMSNAVPNGTVMGNGGIYNAGYGTSGGVNSSVNPSNKNTSTTTTNPTTTTTPTTNKTTAPTTTPSNEEEGEVYVSNPGNYAGGGGTQTSNQSMYDQINAWYEAQKQAVINQIQHAMDQAVADYEASIEGLDRNYQPLRNQSEVERYKSEQALKEQLANGGNTYSGMGRQEALNLQNAYSNNITDINNQQQYELDNLLRAIQNVKAEGEYQKANAGLTYDANQLQSMINQANLDREYEWNKYLQDYQEKQDTLAYDWQKYLQDYKEKTDTIKGVTGSSSSSTAKHTATQAKNWLNNALTTGNVYDGFNEDLDTYYSNYGTYPTDEMIDAFIDQVNEYSGSKYANENYAQSLLEAWLGLGRLNDAQAEILIKMYGY